jgi:hypothetical protein
VDGSEVEKGRCEVSAEKRPIPTKEEAKLAVDALYDDLMLVMKTHAKCWDDKTAYLIVGRALNMAFGLFYCMAYVSAEKHLDKTEQEPK